MCLLACVSFTLPLKLNAQPGSFSPFLFYPLIHEGGQGLGLGLGPPLLPTSGPPRSLGVPCLASLPRIALGSPSSCEPAVSRPPRTQIGPMYMQDFTSGGHKVARVLKRKLKYSLDIFHFLSRNEIHLAGIRQVFTMVIQFA